MFEVRIVSPTQSYPLFQASILNLRTIVGEIGLLSNHMPYLTNLVAGINNYVDENNQRHYFSTGGGVIYFENNQALLLVDDFNFDIAL